MSSSCCEFRISCAVLRLFVHDFADVNKYHDDFDVCRCYPSCTAAAGIKSCPSTERCAAAAEPSSDTTPRYATVDELITYSAE
jgi:hypothetical protein